MMNLNLGVPSLLNMRFTFLRFTDSGRPPQGTNKSADTIGCKWNSFLPRVTSSTLTRTPAHDQHSTLMNYLKVNPEGTTSPEGNLTSLSETNTLSLLRE